MSTNGARSAVPELSALQRRWLAEAVRLAEDRAGRAQEHSEADARARAVGGDLENRILARAESLPQAPAMARAILWHLRLLRAVIAIAAALALLAGIAAARMALGAGGEVNVLHALGALLGVQLLMLLVWLLAASMPGSQGAALGRGLMALTTWLSARFAGGEASGAVLAAARSLFAEGRLGRSLLGAVTHGVWFGYTFGALLACLLLLSVYQFDFHWATTIVPDPVMVGLLQGLGQPPSWLGFPVPDAELIRSARLGVAEGVGRGRWSALLLGSLVAFGLLPRGLLAVLCAWSARRAARGFRLDLTRPGHARLVPRLQAGSRPLSERQPAPSSAATEPQIPDAVPLEVQGLIAMLGMELERPQTQWPPHVDGLDWVVLGRADDRLQQRDVLAALQALPTRPGCLVVLASLLRTPDRGTGAYLRRLKEAAAAPLLLVLDEEERYRRRGGDPQQRVAHWRALAASAGVDAVEVADLESSSDRARLMRRLGRAA